MKIAAQSLTLDRAELRAILTTASKDECRVNLHGVLVDPSRCVLVSTDGHRMTVASASGPRSPDARAVVLPATMLEDVAKRAGAKDRIMLTWDDSDATVATYGPGDDDGPLGPQTTTAGKLSTNAFPPWRAVFPSALHETRVPLTMNPHYVADALLVLAKLQGKSAQVTCYGPAKGEARDGCTADQSAALSPIVFAGHDAERGADWRIVIMPVRPSSMPDWRVEPAAAAEPAIGDGIRREDGASQIVGRKRKAA